MLWKNNQYPWNSEVESIWISLIGWSLRTSISYTFTSLVHHILCIVKHVGMEIIAFTLTSKQTLYALNHYVLLSVLPKVFTQKNHSCRVKMDSFLHRRRSGDNEIKKYFLFDIQTRIRSWQSEIATMTTFLLKTLFALSLYLTQNLISLERTSHFSLTDQLSANKNALKYNMISIKAEISL